ncbi:hypothetical protein GGI43DRAFT_320014 [Trichoderma evansii]
MAWLFGAGIFILQSYPAVKWLVISASFSYRCGMTDAASALSAYRIGDFIPNKPCTRHNPEAMYLSPRYISRCFDCCIRLQNRTEQLPRSIPSANNPPYSSSLYAQKNLPNHSKEAKQIANGSSTRVYVWQCHKSKGHKWAVCLSHG